MPSDFGKTWKVTGQRKHHSGDLSGAAGAELWCYHNIITLLDNT